MLRSGDDIRSIRRGVATLRLLATQRALHWSQIANALDTNRTSTLRILQTLCNLGYVARCEDDPKRRYRLLNGAQRLSAGFSHNSLLLHVAIPLLTEFTRAHDWPLALSAMSGTRLVVRFTTDRLTSRVLTRYRGGVGGTLHLSAAGRVCLAFAPPAVRAAAADVVTRAASPIVRDSNSRTEPQSATLAALISILDEVRSRGFATYHEPGSSECSVAVPIQHDSQCIAALTLRYMRVAERVGMTPEVLVGLLTPLKKRIERDVLASA